MLNACMHSVLAKQKRATFEFLNFIQIFRPRIYFTLTLRFWGIGKLTQSVIFDRDLSSSAENCEEDSGKIDRSFFKDLTVWIMTCLRYYGCSASFSLSRNYSEAVFCLSFFPSKIILITWCSLSTAKVNVVRHVKLALLLPLHFDWFLYSQSIQPGVWALIWKT